MTDSVKNVSTFQNPILAEHKTSGRAIKVLAVGDQEGKSPVYLTCNEEGESEWVSLKDVRIQDTNAKPFSSGSFGRETASSSSRR